MNGTAFDLLEQPVKERLTDQIARQIKKLIYSKNIEVGQKLPTERDLAGILNVSRVVVREALFLRRYFDTKTTWYLQSHLTCDSDFQSFMGSSSCPSYWGFPGGRSYDSSRRNGRTLWGRTGVARGLIKSN